MQLHRLALVLGLLALSADLQTADAQFNIIDVDVTFPATVGSGQDLVVTVPAGVGLPAILFFAPTAALNITTEVYASELGAQLSLFNQHGFAVIQPDFTATWPEVPVMMPTDFTVFIAGFIAPDIIASNLGNITLLPPGCTGTPGHFQESDGLVVAEIESAALVSQWVEASALPGFTGDSYYRWSGPNLFGSPGTGILTYPVEIYTAGVYRIKLHNRHNHGASDMENDCWLRVDGSNWEKYASNAGIVGAWNWAGGLDSGLADYFLDVGTHNIQISARSFGYHIDRMHVYLPGVVSDPLNTAHPESCRP